MQDSILYGYIKRNKEDFSISSEDFETAFTDPDAAKHVFVNVISLSLNYYITPAA